MNINRVPAALSPHHTPSLPNISNSNLAHQPVPHAQTLPALPVHAHGQHQHHPSANFNIRPLMVGAAVRARAQGHGHTRSVSASSGLAMGIGAPQPLGRMGSEPTMDTPVSASAPGLPLVPPPPPPLMTGTGTRPFVPPPPPPPLIPVVPIAPLRPAGSSGSLNLNTNTNATAARSVSPSPGNASVRTHTSTGSESTARGSPATSPTTRTTPPPLPPVPTTLPMPPPPPPPLSMSAVLRSRAGMAPPSAVSSTSSSTPSSARSAPSGYATWRYSDESGGAGMESPMTSVTTPATSRESGWSDDSGRKWSLAAAGAGAESERVVVVSPLAQSAYSSPPAAVSLALSPSSPQNKRERRRLRLHSPVDVDVGSASASGSKAATTPDPPSPAIHSHPLEDEADGSNGPDSALDPPVEDPRGWLAQLEGEVREQEMDGVLLSPPTFAAADPEDFDSDDNFADLNDFELDDGGYMDDPNRLDTRVRAKVERSPSPIRYARRASVDEDIIMSDTSDEDDNMSDLDRASGSANLAPAGDVRSFDSPAVSVFNDAQSTFSRARSTRSRRRRRNTRVAPPPVPLGSAAGLHRPRARSADSSILGLGDAGLAPSEMWRMEQAARAARAQAPPPPPVKEMRYVYQAAAARLPASVPPPPALLLGRGSDGSSQYDSTSTSVSGHEHSSESGTHAGDGAYYMTPSTSKSSLPEPPSRRETVKLSRKEKKEREKAEREREKAMRKSGLPHRSSFSLLHAGSMSTGNSSAEALMIRPTPDRKSSSSNGSDEARPQQRPNKNVLFRSLYGDPVARR